MSSNGQPDPILLSLFANRTMSVAEAMGRTLERTSISTNIKERLDYSCAVFAPDGSLVANAPCVATRRRADAHRHLPVHLGSMSFAVRFQLKHLKGDINEGDVLASNHPVAGGSHLPDVTVITPVFKNGEIIFFVASRGHHADIGGILPGSMPPTSKNIFEEGAQIVSMKLVKQGKYQRDEFLKAFVEDPAKYPGCSGTRTLRDVESDLQAQIAANNKGVALIDKMIEEYGLPLVQEYMLHIRDNAEFAVRNLLKEVAKRPEGNVLEAIDYLDDGTPIQLKVTIDAEAGSAIFDFEGTGSESIGNLNTPTSVSHSAIIYSLRCLVDLDIPLNEGCLVPIEVKLPVGSILNPSPTAAVVGGNVCTSQRVTDVVLKAFKAAAASQGCCNNSTFGSDGFGYYETICGGSGAGPSWNGTTVHTHMTNTRITDVETFERRYPVLVHQFGRREGSGGKGRFNGGDGSIRDIEFLEPVQASILSERRVFQPYGMEGGESGARGKNTWIKLARKEDGDLPDGHEGKLSRRINLGGKQTVKMGAGDRLVIETPGGGGWGQAEECTKESEPTLLQKAASYAHTGSMRGTLIDRLAPDFGGM